MSDEAVFMGGHFGVSGRLSRSVSAAAIDNNDGDDDNNGEKVKYSEKKRLLDCNWIIEMMM